MTISPLGPAGQHARDDELAKVESYFRSIEGLERRAGGAIRRAIDDVIMGPKTGRWDIAQLDKVEKTYIGLRVEIELRAEFDLPRGVRLDCLIEGIEVDIKFTSRLTWMIPPEAYAPPSLCLLSKANDYKSTFSMGLFRAYPDLLNRPNQDRKRSVSKQGMGQIRWLVDAGPLPENLLLHIDPEARERILGPRSGQQRIYELFRLVQGRVIPREVIESVGQQRDSLRRARQARTQLAPGGIIVVCGNYTYQREEARALGVPGLPKSDWCSLKAPPDWRWLPSAGKQGRWLSPDMITNDTND